MLLVAALVMWPRSCFYADMVDEILDDGDAYGICGVSIGGLIFTIEGYTAADEYSPKSTGTYRWLSAPFARGAILENHPELKVESQLWTRGLLPTLTPERSCWIPFPFVIAVCASGLLIVSSTGLLRTSQRWQFALVDLLAVMTVVALSLCVTLVTQRQFGEGGVVIAGEATVLLLAAYAALRNFRGSTGVGKWVRVGIAAGCMAGIAGLGLFYWHCVECFEPLA